jgi:hypothetical protein
MESKKIGKLTNPLTHPPMTHKNVASGNPKPPKQHYACVQHVKGSQLRTQPMKRTAQKILTSLSETQSMIRD